MRWRILRNQHVPIAAQSMVLHVVPEYLIAHLDEKEASAVKKGNHIPGRIEITFDRRKICNSDAEL